MSAPATALQGGVQAVVAAVLALLVGYAAVTAVTRLKGARMDVALRVGLAPAAFMGVVLVAMLAHILTAGGVFSDPLWTRAISAGVVAAGVATLLFVRRRNGGPGRGHLVALTITAVLAVSIWCAPLFVHLTFTFGGDVPWHLAFASQLLNGRPIPVSWMVGPFPNDYPWLFHSLLAFLAALLPGGRAIHAFSAAQVFIVAGSVVTLYALGRELLDRVSAAVAAAMAGALCGGFGFFVTGATPTVVHPRDNAAAIAAHFGDFLLRRSYNISFHHLSPPFPRELSFLLLEAFLLLVLLAWKRRSVGAFVAAGVVMGLLGLTGGESTFVALGIAVVVVVIGTGVPRWRSATALFVPALLISSLWFVPVILNYLRFGGFDDLSASLVAYPPLAILGAWGMTTPFALYAAGRSIVRREGDAGTLLLAIAGGVALTALLLASLGSRYLGPGFQTLGRSHRYWPLVHLVVALFAAKGFGWVMERLSGARIVAVALAGLVFVAAIASPLIATSYYVEDRNSPDLLEDATGNTSRTVLNVLAPQPGGRCIAAAPQSVAPQVAAFTGYRVVVLWDRVRYRELMPRKEHRLRLLHNAILVSGRPGDRWERLATRYGVDVVVAVGPLASGPAPRSVRRRMRAGPYQVLWRRPSCRRPRP